MALYMAPIRQWQWCVSQNSLNLSQDFIFALKPDSEAENDILILKHRTILKLLFPHFQKQEYSIPVAMFFLAEAISVCKICFFFIIW